MAYEVPGAPAKTPCGATPPGAKPCCSGCAGAPLGNDTPISDTSIYGILVVGGLLWAMFRVAR